MEKIILTGDRPTGRPVSYTHLDVYKRQHPNKAQVSRYLINEGFPLYKHTAVKYFEVGEKKFDALFEDLEKAEKFIFLEYFIVSDGEIWQRLKEVVARKAAQKVEVLSLIHILK